MQSLKTGKEVKEMPKANRLSYAIYLLIKHIQIDPNWLLLRFSELSTRDNYRDYYFNLVNEENAFLNPILIIVIILHFMNIPPIYKEMLILEEWFNVY